MNLLHQLKEDRRLAHWSVSSLNAAVADTALWAMERIKKLRAPVGAAAHRGTASELGVAAFLKGEADYEQAAHLALVEFDRLTALSGDPNRDKEREAVKGIVEQGIECLKGYGKPSETQRQITWTHPDLELPFLGYVDFDWSDHGLLVDMKSTLRLPSSISPSHARQVALYAAATGDNYGARVAYITPKKAEVYQLENNKAHIDALVNIAKRMERLLSKFDDEDDFIACMTPNYDSFYWNSQQARQLGFETYGF